jgi:hypothetical protein
MHLSDSEKFLIKLKDVLSKKSDKTCYVTWKRCDRTPTGKKSDNKPTNFLLVRVNIGSKDKFSVILVNSLYIIRKSIDRICLNSLMMIKLQHFMKNCMGY